MPPGDVFPAWQFPLHNGEAAGMLGRIAVFIAGIAAALLYITGIVIWWRKRRGRIRATRLRANG